MTTPDTRKTVLITGASTGGIGGALSASFLSAGWRVFAGVRRLPSAPVGSDPISLDVTSNTSIAAAVEHIASATCGRLDMLINNAGLAIHAPITDLDVDGAVKDMFEVNVFGAMKMVQAFAGLLIRAQGAVVNIGSIAPILPMVYSAAYNASKAALIAYGDSARMELRPFGVQVVTVITGGVRSNIVSNGRPQLPEGSLFEPVKEFYWKRAGQSQDGTMQTEEYAKGVVRMLTSGRRLPRWFWWGTFARLAWLLWTFAPWWVRERFMRRMMGLEKLAAIVKERKRKEIEEGKTE